MSKNFINLLIVFSPTNTSEEQTIRKVVIDRKVTQGARNDLENR